MDMRRGPALFALLATTIWVGGCRGRPRSDASVASSSPRLKEAVAIAMQQLVSDSGAELTNQYHAVAAEYPTLARYLAYSEVLGVADLRARLLCERRLVVTPLGYGYYTRACNEQVGYASALCHGRCARARDTCLASAEQGNRTACIERWHQCVILCPLEQ